MRYCFKKFGMFLEDFIVLGVVFLIVGKSENLNNIDVFNLENEEGCVFVFYFSF